MWLQDMHKHFNRNADGYDVIQDALDAMTYVAHHINEMKRKHEAAVRVQEIQSQMVGLEVSRESFLDSIIGGGRIETKKWSWFSFILRSTRQFVHLLEKDLCELPLWHVNIKTRKFVKF